MLKKNVKYALTAAINAVELTGNLFFILCNTSVEKIILMLAFYDLKLVKNMLKT